MALRLLPSGGERIAREGGTRGRQQVGLKLLEVPAEHPCRHLQEVGHRSLWFRKHRDWTYRPSRQQCRNDHWTCGGRTGQAQDRPQEKASIWPWAWAGLATPRAGSEHRRSLAGAVPPCRGGPGGDGGPLRTMGVRRSEKGARLHCRVVLLDHQPRAREVSP